MRPFLLAGEWRQGTTPLAVTDPFTGEVFDEVPMGTWADLDEALTAAGSSFERTRNHVCRKVAPALGAGNPIIGKPAPATPISSMLLGEILVEAGVGDAMSVLLAPNVDAERAVADPRVPVVTFTGSTPVGWHLKS